MATSKDVKLVCGGLFYYSRTSALF